MSSNQFLQYKNNSFYSIGEEENVFKSIFQKRSAYAKI